MNSVDVERVASEYLTFSSLKPWSGNPRRISESGVSKVVISMCVYGFGAPLLARLEDRRLIAGHTRLRAFKRLLEMVEMYGLPPEIDTVVVPADPNDPEGKDETTRHHKSTPSWVDLPEDRHPPDWFVWMNSDIRECLIRGEVPVRLMDLTEQHADELALADNRLGEEAEWDQDMLSEMFQAIPTDDHLFTGFDANELEPLLAYQAPTPPQAPEGGTDTPAAPTTPPGRTLAVRFDPGQRVAVDAAQESARSLWDRPDMPLAEFLSELCRQFLQRHPGVLEVPVPSDPVTPSTGAEDF